IENERSGFRGQCPNAEARRHYDNAPKNNISKIFWRIFMSVVLCSCFFMAQAQNNSLGKSDPDAKKVLDGLSAKLKSFKAVQSAFTLKVEDAKGKLQGTKSGVVYVKGTKYHFSIAGGQEVFSDGKDTWTYDKSSNEVTITKIDAS